ncbi:hypothetical protein LY474_22425 [Myxococcus stipitatus]|uniref:hypothetical protein n=1 Tax=Myxococcus stipitatus TaxID=83455 RepID=UPI001F330298|nr:hypothetical protein [Myxococcus stipitatus]MCE9670565.1 hypothetical protein [Myxococcus stipitatus]
MFVLSACATDEREVAEGAGLEDVSTREQSLVDIPFVGVEELWGNERMGTWHGGKFLVVQDSLVEVWNDNGKLGIRQFRVPSSGVGLEEAWSATFAAHTPDGEFRSIGDSLVKLSNNLGRLKVVQFRLNANGIGFGSEWDTGDIDEGYPGQFLVLGDSVLHVWDDSGKTFIMQYRRDADGLGFSTVFRLQFPPAYGHEYRVMGDSLVQLRQDATGRVDIYRYKLDSSGIGFTLASSQENLDRPWGAQYHVIGNDILQLRNNNGRLAMVRYGLLPTGGFEAQPEQPDVGAGFSTTNVVVGSTLVQLWNNEAIEGGPRLGIIPYARGASDAQYTIRQTQDMFEPFEGTFLAMGERLVQVTQFDGQLALVQYGHWSCPNAPHLTEYGYYSYYQMEGANDLDVTALGVLSDHSKWVPLYPGIMDANDPASMERMAPKLKAKNMKGMVFLWAGGAMEYGLENANGELLTTCDASGVPTGTWKAGWDRLVQRLDGLQCQKPCPAGDECPSCPEGEVCPTPCPEGKVCTEPCYPNGVDAFNIEESFWRPLSNLQAKEPPELSGPSDVIEKLEYISKKLKCLVRQIRIAFPDAKIMFVETPGVFLGDYRELKNVWSVCNTCRDAAQIPSEVDYVGSYFYGGDSKAFSLRDAWFRQLRNECVPSWSHQATADCKKGPLFQSYCPLVDLKGGECLEKVDAERLSEAMENKLQRKPEQRLLAILSGHLDEAAGRSVTYLREGRRDLANRVQAMVSNDPQYAGFLTYFWSAGAGTGPNPLALDELLAANPNDPFVAKFRNIGLCVQQ